MSWARETAKEFAIRPVLNRNQFAPAIDFEGGGSPNFTNYHEYGAL
jgi:hypothetical protein